MDGISLFFITGLIDFGIYSAGRAVDIGPLVVDF